MTSVRTVIRVNELLRKRLDLGNINRGTPVAWVNLLLLVADNQKEGVMMSDGSRALEISRSNLTRVVRLLGESGLVDLQDDPIFLNRKRIFLAGKGLVLMEEVQKILK